MDVVEFEVYITLVERENALVSGMCAVSYRLGGLKKYEIKQEASAMVLLSSKLKIRIFALFRMKSDR